MSEDLGNEILVHRFIDGEMSPTEEDAFLAECEADPSSYRLLALALIERDRWGKQCAGVREPIPVMLQNRSTKQGWETRLRGLAIVAASILFGLTGGYLWNREGADKRGLEQGLPLAVKQEEPTYREPSVGSESGEEEITRTERVPTTYANYQESDEAISTLISAFQPEPLVPVEDVQQLRESGLRVEENTKLYLLELSDGRHLAVPTQFVRFSSQ